MLTPLPIFLKTFNIKFIEALDERFDLFGAKEGGENVQPIQPIQGEGEGGSTGR